VARGRFVSKEISLDEKVKRPVIPVDLARRVIKRDKCTCQYCGKVGEFVYRYGKPTVVENPNGINLNAMEFYNGPDVIPFQIDHIIPISQGGQNTEDNLLLSCRHCNLSKGAKHG
jgi:5-methylcytosine-specific restriction endonuclease McrA